MGSPRPDDDTVRAYIGMALGSFLGGVVAGDQRWSAIVVCAVILLGAYAGLRWIGRAKEPFDVLVVHFGIAPVLVLFPGFLGLLLGKP